MKINLKRKAGSPGKEQESSDEEEESEEEEGGGGGREMQGGGEDKDSTPPENKATGNEGTIIDHQMTITDPNVNLNEFEEAPCIYSELSGILPLHPREFLRVSKNI